MSPIPKTAPFADDEIEILNQVVGPATPVPPSTWTLPLSAGIVFRWLSNVVEVALAGRSVVPASPE